MEYDIYFYHVYAFVPILHVDFDEKLHNQQLSSYLGKYIVRIDINAIKKHENE